MTTWFRAFSLTSPSTTNRAPNGSSPYRIASSANAMAARMNVSCSIVMGGTKPWTRGSRERWGWSSRTSGTIYASRRLAHLRTLPSTSKQPTWSRSSQHVNREIARQRSHQYQPSSISASTHAGLALASLDGLHRPRPYSNIAPSCTCRSAIARFETTCRRPPVWRPHSRKRSALKPMYSSVTAASSTSWPTAR